MSKTTFPQLKKPPITEAIFEVLFTLEDDFNVEDFAKFCEKFSSQFTRKDEITVLEGKIDAKNLAENSLKSSKIGYILLNEDKSKAIQIRNNGFTYSLSNSSYKNWDSFKSDAYSFFHVAIELYNIKKVLRTSLRYINSINLPVTLTDIKEYILIAPEVPKNLSLGLSKMFTQITMPNEIIGGVGIVTQSFDAAYMSGDSFSFILDIDVQIMCDCGSNDGIIESNFEKLHDFKNQIFFNSVTNKTIENFQK